MSSTIPRGHWPTSTRGHKPILARSPEAISPRGPEPTFPRDHNRPAFQPDPDPWFDLRMAAWQISVGVVAAVGSMVLPQIL